jgi:hypothetical protein
MLRHCAGVSLAVRLSIAIAAGFVNRFEIKSTADISSASIGNVNELIGSVGELQAPFPDPERFIDRQYLRAAGVE